MKTLAVVTILAGALMFGFFSQTGKSHAENKNPDLLEQKPEDAAYISLGGGCFWCLEWEYNALPGVLYTESGYQGGTLDNPTYRDITTGKTGHAEVVRVFYDPEKITLRDLFDYFLRKAHDPTQLNRQGVDVGTQYRSVIFYANEDEKRIAEEAIAAAEADKAWKDPIVTTLESATNYYPAEQYHQDYYEKYEDQNGAPHIRVLLKEKNKASK
ncbi:MAG: peptide-methionine (S)-S-oxide reductase MsrA [Pseudomonadota bacterium]